MNALEFKKQLGNALQGTKIVYHSGSLMFDRLHNKTLDHLANKVWEAAGMRLVRNARPSAPKDHTDQWLATGERRVVLTQRRLSDPMGWDYMATKL